MRPVNLIPPEDRAGRRRPLRAGPLAYIIVGALAAALIGVTTLVTTDNAISDRKAEIAQIESEVSAANARAASLRAYTQFHEVREQRMATITSLANSRFDWERVMRELALILPENVWLIGLNASAAAASGSGEGASLAGGVIGPSLDLTGCATGQEAVAGFIQALKEIDGVTRVGMQGSALGGAGAVSTGGSVGAACPGKKFIAQFQMTVAFDAAPVPTEASSAEAGATEAPPAPPPTEGATTSEPATTTTSESSGGGG
jgi:Tfp pilus assembly protein PilN